MLTDEEAKAVQEVAKTGREGLALVRDVFGYFAHFAQGPSEQVSGMITDYFKFRRLGNFVQYKSRVEGCMAKLCLDKSTRAVPLNFIVPVLEAGSLEEDDSLQDMWARLLVNAADAESGVEPRHAFVSILKDMTPLDAQLLNAIVSDVTVLNLSSSDLKVFGGREKWMFTVRPLGKERGDVELPSDAQLSLQNLKRLNMLEEHSSLGIPTIINSGYVTPLAFAFVKACTLRTERNE